MLTSDKNRELKLVIAALVLTACNVLGIDVQVLLAQFQINDPELIDMIALIKQGSKSGGWQSIVAMWFGVGVYSWLRTKIKLNTTQDK
jgi:hypothetical protein